jgi:hypothetical protein
MKDFVTGWAEAHDSFRLTPASMEDKASAASYKGGAPRRRGESSG